MSGADDGDQPDTVAERRGTPRAPRPAARTDRDEDAEALPAGTAAGRYVLLARLGAGGAGLVYSAYDPTLDRKVAIKLLRAAAPEAEDTSQGSTRLLREAQAMARLKHPNILPVYDVGALDHALGARVFMAMELVDGGTLRAWLAQRHSRREIIDVLTSCGRGLAAAHAAGLVHRDFKPDNVLIDRDGRVFVTDFGLVRTEGPSEATTPDATAPSALASPLTAIDTVLGTPGYMAPEQYRGEPIDARTDQFSFCLTLCEALCGKRIVVGQSMKELETATLDLEHAAEALRAAKVPSWLARVVLRGLAREREARFPGMEALLEALRRDPARRTRRIAAVFAALALAGGAAIGVGRLGLDAHPAPPCSGGAHELAGVWDDAVRDRVRHAFDRANASARFQTVATALDGYAHDFLTQSREACEATRVRGVQPESVLALRTSCLDRRRKELAAVSSLLVDVDPATALHAVEMVARLTSIQSCGDLAALTARVPPPTDPRERGKVDALRTELARSKALANAARYPEARAIVARVLQDEAKVPYGPLRAAALEQLAQLQREQDGDMKAARGSLVEAIAAAYASHDDARVASAMTELAMLEAYWLDDHEAGERWVRLAEAAIQRLGGSEELEAERERVDAEILIGEDKGAPAVAAAEPALRLAEHVYGPQSLQVTMFHATLGAAYAASGNDAKAGEHYEAQRAILEKLVGPEHPLVAMALNNLGLNAEAEGHLAEAERDYQSSVSMLEKTLGPDHPRVAIALSNLGAALASDHKPAEALAAFQRSLAIDDRRFGTSYPDSLDDLLGIGEALVALDRPRDALPTIQRALNLAESGDPDAWGVAEAQFALAEALWNSGGDRAQARKLAAQARTGMAAEHNDLAKKTLAEIDAWIARNGSAPAP